MRDAKLVIMDEPTAALGVTQTAMVLDLIKSSPSRGIAVLVISHNLNDVFAGRRPDRRPVPRRLDCRRSSSRSPGCSAGRAF
jgi:alpha-D-ribose 1-methylphosphonate 5-triphosphate synthase subunit PhnL